MALSDYLPQEGSQRFTWADDPNKSIRRVVQAIEAAIAAVEAGEVTPEAIITALETPAVEQSLDAKYMQGRPCSEDGTDGLPTPTGVGMEFVINATGLEDIRYNGESL